MRQVARAAKRAIKRGLSVGTMRVGRIAATAPLSKRWGLDRGTPIDRHYIESFVKEHAADVRGHVLEVKNDDYATRTGGKNIVHLDIITLEHGLPQATMVGDIAEPGTLPAEQFNCIILTQTLHLIFDMEVALANIRRALAPGGVALITVPGITAILPDASFPWYWSLTQQSLTRLVEEAFGQGNATVETFGNLYAATAFLHAAAVQEVSRAKLDIRDPAYPVIVAARATAA